MNAIFYTVLVCSLSGTIAGAAVLLFRRLTEKLISPNWRYILWAIPVLLLLVPFKIPLNLGSADALQLSDTAAINNVRELPVYFGRAANDQNTQLQVHSSPEKQAAENNSTSADPQREVQAAGEQALNEQQNVQPTENQLSAFSTPDFIFNTVIPAAWIIGVSVILAFSFFSAIRLNRRIKILSTGTVDEEISRVVLQCSDILKLEKPPDVAVQSCIKTSALTGVFHPRIILPAYAAGLDEETLKYIIIHELSHFKRRDTVINYLMIIVQAIHWFNPVVWYCLKNIRQDMELATDFMVLSYLQEPEHKQYALSLLRVVGTEQGISMPSKLLCMADSHKNIKRRISMIKHNGLFRRRPVLVAVFCAFVMTLAGTVFFTVKPDAADKSYVNQSGNPANSSANPDPVSNPSALKSQNQPTAKPSAADTDSSGRPTSNQYASLCFLNDSIGWVVQGSAGLADAFQLLSTADGGNSWTEVYNGSLAIKNLDFISRQMGWAIVQTSDEQYSIDKTEDGGKTWVTQKQCAVSDNENRNMKIEFFDSNNGYVFIGDKLLKTYDGGNTWTDITPDNGFLLTDCSLISAVNGWVCGTENGNIVALHTSDGGGSWTQRFEVASSDTDFTAPLKIDFISETTGWILLDNSFSGTSKPTLYKTSDGGNSFVGIGYVASHRPYPTDLCFTEDNIGFVGTNHGAGPISGGLMMTTDGGKSFNSLINNIGGIDSIVFPSPEVGYAIGYNDTDMCSAGFILGTTDGGKSWHQISKIAPTIGISFVDGKNGFGIGIGSDAGALLKTSDGGATWSYFNTFSPKCLYAAGISFVSKTTGYVIAGPPDGSSLDNDLYKTTDGGKTWTVIGKVSAYCDYFKMFDEKRGIASGLNSGSVTYNKTTDGGKTWTPVPINAKGDKIISAFSSPEQGIVAGFSYQDQVVTFGNYKNGNYNSPVATWPNTEFGCSGICMAGRNAIALIYTGNSSGSSETMIISRDGGATWKQIPLSEETGYILLQVENHRNGTYMDFPNSKDGFIMVPGYSSLLCTNDGGSTWSWN